jgi:Flp pilus assembly protein TadG
MRPSRRWASHVATRFRDAVRGVVRDDRGSASLEFITVGVLLLVPTVYLVLALSALESASFGVEGAARQATRVFVQSESEGAAESAARAAIQVTLADYGLDAHNAQVAISCRPNPADCLTRRGYVTVTITTTVPLPLMPPVLQLHLPAGIPVQSVATEQVSRFWGSR